MGDAAAEPEHGTERDRFVDRAVELDAAPVRGDPGLDLQTGQLGVSGHVGLNGLLDVAERQHRRGRRVTTGRSR